MKASTFDRDANGVPILKRGFLERKAEEVIEYADPDVLRKPLFTPMGVIAQRLTQDYGVIFTFDQDLGTTKNGREILGVFSIPRRAVAVTNTLEPDSPRWRFTLAHEVGHLVLHRWQGLVDSGVLSREGEITDTDSEIDEPIIQPKESRDWMEWQANKFAASLLMPRLTFRQVTLDAMEEVGIDRLSYRIYVDDQECNIVLYRRVLRIVAETFRCSQQATEIRLKELYLVDDHRQKDEIRLADLLKETDT